MECDKVPYKRESDARRFAEIVRKRKVRMSTYYCRECKAWHLTTAKKAQSKLRRTRNK